MLNQGQGLSLQEFNVVFSKCQQKFIRFAASYIYDLAAAEDIVVDSFMAAWEGRAGLEAEGFPAYVLTSVRNKCLNYLRARNTHELVRENIRTHSQRLLESRISMLEACDPVELFSSETKQMVDKAISALPKHTREIFIRSRIDGQKYKEIASEMNITVKSVEFEISKATKLLRAALKDYMPALTLLWWM